MTTPGSLTEERLKLDKSDAAIREMFSGVAPRYDLLNHLLSGWLDLSWRRHAARALNLAPGALVLDLCCGTGDQAIALGGRGLRTAAADFCLPMLALARHKYSRSRSLRPAGLAADALELPFADQRFAGTTVAFGLRNLADLDAGLGEIHRVVRADGKVAFLEFALPRRRWLKHLYLFYFRRILPRIGRLLSPRGTAYEYLRDSVLEFPQRDQLIERMRVAGFTHGAWRDLAGGTVCLYTGVRRGEQ